MKNIKKRQIISGVLAAAMLCTGTGVFAELAEVKSDEKVIDYGDTTYQKQNNSGTVKSIEEKQILIANGDEEIIINTDEDTIFLSADGTGLNLEEIKNGDIVNVVMSKAMTRSIPPQSYGYVVIKGDEKAQFPIYMEVSSIEKDENENIKFLSADGMYNAVYSEKTRVVPFKTKNIIDASDINKGSKILVYADLMTMSIPALVPATRIVLLEQGEDKKISETEKIILNGKEFAVKVENNDGNVFLPVRDVCENVGLDVEWNDGLKAVRVGTIQMGVTFNIGINKYNKAKMAEEQLSAAPELINEKAYLPLDFFTEILAGKAEINENGLLSLSI
ncbi:MAG: copper amine oxidase N-terminal domain-containing protein [Firmicutes bacterium]|nr:copper amine oxidase N-terminal domain-containing protein [Bacillota bacterium]